LQKTGKNRVRLLIYANAKDKVWVFVSQEALSATLIKYTKCDG
jgi:hypothetical protein